jgi:hypothetical protein
MNLIDIYKILYPILMVYTFFSAVNGTFSKIDHILNHKTSLNKYQKKKKETRTCILSDHNEMRLGISNKRNY